MTAKIRIRVIVDEVDRDGRVAQKSLLTFWETEDGRGPYQTTTARWTTMRLPITSPYGASSLVFPMSQEAADIIWAKMKVR